MPRSLSVLQNVTGQAVRHKPFPHVVIRNALPDDLCDRLLAEYPSLDAMDVNSQANNKRWSYPSDKVLTNGRISPLWKDFIAYHASEAFFREVVDLFADDITRLYPTRFPDRTSIDELRVGMRRRDTDGPSHILLDAQISGNTPVTTANSVRTTHVDKGDKLFSGLLYLRPPIDSSIGGDLTISRFKPRFSTEASRLWRFKRVYVDDRDVDVVETVRYEKNTLVLFINSIASLHGVTVRQPTEHARIFVNLVGELQERLYHEPNKWQLLPTLLKERVLGA